MLKVTFEEKDGNLNLTLEGHAGQADIGHDIVCSSASILAYTVAQLVRDYEACGLLKGDPVIKLEKGDAVISCRPKRKAYEEMQYAYYVAKVGYTLLAHNYPQFVELKMFGTVLSRKYKPKRVAHSRAD
jgi:uncharacterized protein YsxB (DUF464 family)